MPGPTHIPQNLPFPTPWSKGASGGPCGPCLQRLSVPGAVSSHMEGRWEVPGRWHRGQCSSNASGGLMDRTQVSSPLGQDNSEMCPTHCPRGPQQDWGSVTSSETCSLRHTVLTPFLPLAFPTSLLTFPEITPHKCLQLIFLRMVFLRRQCIDFQPGVCPKGILLILSEKKVLFRRPTTSLCVCPCPTVK